VGQQARSHDQESRYQVQQSGFARGKTFIRNSNHRIDLRGRNWSGLPANLGSWGGTDFGTDSECCISRREEDTDIRVEVTETRRQHRFVQERGRA